jgi:protein-disulfide isomerase
MKKEWLFNSAVGLMVLCALLVTVLVVRRELFAGNGATSAADLVYVDGWREYARGGHLMGPKRAPVTLVVFSDFQCPACRVLAGSVHEVRTRHPGAVNVVYRHFPLRAHAAAIPAARASECAAAQGRFEAFHDVVFARQDSLGRLPWASLARDAGVPDLAAFDRCERDASPLPALAADTAAGARLGVTGTPTLLINGRRLVGAPATSVLDEYVREALTTARR